MKLYQVRKGQFVYYNNELHKVYGVKPVYKQSVHLIRLRDLKQQLSNAASVDKYKPKELDSFIFNHRAYTLNKTRTAEVGDYILIHNPRNDSLDTYSLNEIEVVETVEKQGVITTNSHGIGHSEYLLMVPGRANDSHPIDYQHFDGAEQETLDDISPHHLPNQTSELLPSLGDIYKKKDSKEEVHIAMVVAIKGQMVYLGDGAEVAQEELMNIDQWEFLYSLIDS